jgi:hypothetical protein
MSWKVVNLKDKNFDALIGQNILKPLGIKIDLLYDQIEVNNRIIKLNSACPFNEINQLEALQINENELFNKLINEKMNSEEIKYLK